MTGLAMYGYSRYSDYSSVYILIRIFRPSGLAVEPESTARTMLTRTEQIDRFKTRFSGFEVNDAAAAVLSNQFCDETRLWQFAMALNSAGSI